MAVVSPDKVDLGFMTNASRNYETHVSRSGIRRFYIGLPCERKIGWRPCHQVSPTSGSEGEKIMEQRDHDAGRGSKKYTGQFGIVNFNALEIPTTLH